MQVPCGVSAERVAVAPADATPECSSWFDAVGVGPPEEPLPASEDPLGALFSAFTEALCEVPFDSARATTGEASTGAAAIGSFRSLFLYE